MNHPLRWENIAMGRYYLVHLQADLFQHWSVMCIWGGIGSKRGGRKNHAFLTLDDALIFIDEVAKRRKNRGYAVSDYKSTCAWPCVGQHTIQPEMGANLA